MQRTEKEKGKKSELYNSIQQYQLASAILKSDVISVNKQLSNKKYNGEDDGGKVGELYCKKLEEMYCCKLKFTGSLRKFTQIKQHPFP